MTKRIRRLLSLAFALALLAGLALPACAEGTIAPAVPRPVQMEQALQAAQAAQAVSDEAGSIRHAGEEAAAHAVADREIYVSADGDDMGEGTRDDPLASLAAAAEAANAAVESKVYVILLSDLVSTRTARFLGKDVVLMSEGGTWLISRGDSFLPAYDGVRQAYNPALIEVGELQSTQALRTSLSIDNVVLDDGGLHEGSEFLPQSADAEGEQGNLARVQDAIVAVYDGATLTLNPGTELRNFGGMSAVRAVGNALVTAEDFSAILDTAPIDAPAGLRTILAEGAAVRIGSRASVFERGAAPEKGAPEELPDEEEPDEELPEEEIPEEERPEEENPNAESLTIIPHLETPNGESLTIIPHLENVEAAASDDNQGGADSALRELLEQLLALIGVNADDFTPEDLQALLADVPVEDLQALISALSAEDNSGAADLIEQLADVIGGDSGAGDELIGRLNELIGGGNSGGDPLQALSDLLGEGFSPDQLADLLADVPAGDVQDLLSALTGDDNSGAADLVDRLSGLIGGDSGAGDELIGRLNELIGGGNSGNSGSGGGDGDALKTLADLLGDSFTLGELSGLIGGFSPDQLASLANLINGNGTDADITNLFSNMAGLTGLMEMSGEPAYLIRGEEPYLLRGTLTVKLPDRLVRTVKLAASAASEGTGEFTVTPDSRLNVVMKDGAPDTVFTSNIFQADSVTLTDGNLVVSFSLKEGWREHLDELNAPIRFQWKSVLEEQDFAVGEYLVTRAVLDSLEINVGGRTVPGRMDNVSAELRTRMLPGEGSMLSYDINGGEGGPVPNPVFVNMQTGYALESENTPTHADVDGKPVVFIGWTAEKDTAIYARGESAPDTLTTIDVGMSEDRTVFALYGFDENGDGIPDARQQLVQLSFDANGGAGAPDPILAVAVAGVGASIDIPETEPTLKYYTFLGWSKDQGAAEADYKYNAEKAAHRDILITKDTTLYAVWQQNPSYTLYYNANGGTGAPAAQTGISDENDSVELTISSAVPERSGYSFLGWSSRRSGSAEFFAGDKVNITGGNVTLYAVWQKGGSSYSGGGGGGGSGVPKTGDDAPIALYAALAVISLGAVGAGAWLILHKKK